MDNQTQQGLRQRVSRLIAVQELLSREICSLTQAMSSIRDTAGSNFTPDNVRALDRLAHAECSVDDLGVWLVRAKELLTTTETPPRGISKPRTWVEYGMDVQ
jgi:hypothetical protein